MLRDVDGNSRTDFINNFTSLIHGHAHKDVLAAVMSQLPSGTAYASPTQGEIELAEELKRRVPSIESMMFNNSGSEAVLGAVRAARAFTGRTKIAKFEGAYHGSYDYVAVSGKSVPTSSNDADAPVATADSEGLHPSAVEDAVVMRFNSISSVERALEAHGTELAAVIVEPICGSAGMIPAEHEFMRALRRETERRGILLICDEVIALRLGIGGGQGEYGIRPDLTSMAKIIGGGFPIGAFGGRRDIMEVFAVGGKGPRALHLGTFNANPISTCAGLATLRALDAAAFGRTQWSGRSGAHGVTRNPRRSQHRCSGDRRRLPIPGPLHRDAGQRLSQRQDSECGRGIPPVPGNDEPRRPTRFPRDGLPLDANATDARGPPGGSVRRDASRSPAGRLDSVARIGDPIDGEQLRGTARRRRRNHRRDCVSRAHSAPFSTGAAKRRSAIDTLRRAAGDADRSLGGRVSSRASQSGFPAVAEPHPGRSPPAPGDRRAVSEHRRQPAAHRHRQPRCHLHGSAARLLHGPLSPLRGNDGRHR